MRSAITAPRPGTHTPRLLQRRGPPLGARCREYRLPSESPAPCAADVAKDWERENAKEPTHEDGLEHRSRTRARTPLRLPVTTAMEPETGSRCSRLGRRRRDAMQTPDSAWE